MNIAACAVMNSPDAGYYSGFGRLVGDTFVVASGRHQADGTGDVWLQCARWERAVRAYISVFSLWTYFLQAFA